MNGMRSVRVKHVDEYVDRHGKIRIYFRNKSAGGKRIALRGPIGSPEFWQDYEKASGAPTGAGGRQAASRKDTITWLVSEYYRSSSFKQLASGTRRNRQLLLTRFCENHGDKRYAKLEPKHLRRIRDGMSETPGSANNLMKALRQVFKFAVEYDLIDRNPVAEVTRLKSRNKDGHRAWTLAEVAQFEATHPIGSKPRLALALLLYTGQRRGDIVRLGCQHEKEKGWLQFTQQKTKKPMSIPIFKELREIIDASPTGDLTYLVTSHNKPFTPNGFGNWFRAQCNAAGLTKVSAHGLRKTAGEIMAEAGHSPHEIAAIGGWESLQEVERYTKSASQKRLAERVRDQR